MCVYVVRRGYVQECHCSERPEVWDPRRAGVTGGCELSDVGAKNNTWVC